MRKYSSASHAVRSRCQAVKSDIERPPARWSMSVCRNRAQGRSNPPRETGYSFSSRFASHLHTLILPGLSCTESSTYDTSEII